jgi:hypothetical protein
MFVVEGREMGCSQMTAYELTFSGTVPIVVFSQFKIPAFAATFSRRTYSPSNIIEGALGVSQIIPLNNTPMGKKLHKNQSSAASREFSQ